jgi:putative hemolysin
MQTRKSHYHYLFDEHGGLEGIITLEDLLEEIVGEISDEHDEEVNEQITQLSESEFQLEGGLAVRDLNRRLKLSVPESESYTTIGGFLMTAAGHVLKPGDVVRHNGLVFKIERVERRRVARVKLTLTPETSEAESEPTLGARAAG